jgi:ubiquitin-protein ligase
MLKQMQSEDHPDETNGKSSGGSQLSQKRSRPMAHRDFATKRLLSELRDLTNNPDPDFVAAPVGDDLFVWHFTIRGPRGTPFEGGLYHGRILFPLRFPLQPPDIFFITPNGRFALDTAICLNVTSYHPEEWSPGWSIRVFLTSIIAFLPTETHGAMGAIECDAERRRELAIQSRSWKCPQCDLVLEPDPIPETPTELVEVQEEAAEEVVEEVAQTEEAGEQLSFAWQDLMDRADVGAPRWAIPYFDIPIIVVVVIIAALFVEEWPVVRGRL